MELRNRAPITWKALGFGGSDKAEWRRRWWWKVESGLHFDASEERVLNLMENGIGI